VNLSLQGIDPRELFRTEAFYGSHRSALAALTSGKCDVTGTYARADDSGHVTSGAWTEHGGAEVRVIATFGAIPPDVIAVRSAIAEGVRAPALSALKSICTDQKDLARSIFGGDDLREGLAPGYESLKGALEMATSRGIFGDR
jgi:ABC-type phosphate/phosphonate transport system substrate-binding protein